MSENRGMGMTRPGSIWVHRENYMGVATRPGMGPLQVKMGGWRPTLNLALVTLSIGGENWAPASRAVEVSLNPMAGDDRTHRKIVMPDVPQNSLKIVLNSHGLLNAVLAVWHEIASGVKTTESAHDRKALSDVWNEKTLRNGRTIYVSSETNAIESRKRR